MTPQEFIAKWQDVTLSERSACQQHFLDICEMLGQPKPADVDKDGSWYTFERGVEKTDGRNGWADVWMHGHFGWEYKRRHKDLAAAYQQLLKYREALNNPPLLVVCDMDRFEVHTNFTGTTKTVYQFDLTGLEEPDNLDVLRRIFTDPQSLKPGETTAAITERATKQFAILADGMRGRGVDPHAAAHFLMKLMFCMFAEDVGLLKGDEPGEKLFSKVLSRARSEPERLSKSLAELFSAMSTGGDFWGVDILHFNGGLFKDAEVIELTPQEISILSKINDYDWSSVEPSIFGTLFERTLDPAKRSQIGAHYTSREDIETLLEPVMMAPLRREWDGIQTKAESLFEKVREQARKDAKAGRRRKIESKASRDLTKLIREFVERLAAVRVLDPACGSGNFLYVSLHLLLDLEKEVISFAGPLGLGLLPQVRPTQLSGIEINPYSQELAQVVIWIGFLQWMHHNGFPSLRNPVLDPIDTIENKDAILDLTGEYPAEPEWPEADFIVGNPPFLGGKRIRSEIGEAYVESVYKVWDSRLPRFSDLCCYWFEKARHQIECGKAKRAGLLATQGVRGGANRESLKRIKSSGDIFFGVSDRNWILDGATVHVSMVGFDDGSECSRLLDDRIVGAINSNLSASADITQAKPLLENASRSYVGIQKSGAFDIPLVTAIEFLNTPNASGRNNSDVLRPYLNALDIVRRPQDVWIIDFDQRSLEDAAPFEAPFEHVKKHVKPMRDENCRKRHRIEWWRYGETRQGLRASTLGFRRMLVTPHVAKHRVFTWADSCDCPSNLLIATATEDDSEFGILQSRAHEVWALAVGTQLREKESGFRYTVSTCFETFPFPEPTDSQREAIAQAARELDGLRNNWLNPPEWTREDVLEFPGSFDGP